MRKVLTFALFLNLCLAADKFSYDTSVASSFFGGANEERSLGCDYNECRDRYDSCYDTSYCYD